MSSSDQDKPWLRDDFRVPPDLQQREAMWGQVLETWMTPEDARCRMFEYGVHVCDHPNGSIYVEVKADHVMWIEEPDGSKDWLIPPYTRRR